jgi:acyl-CoA synthetase (AMP-forming)/AMP-acid ligase II
MSPEHVFTNHYSPVIMRRFELEPFLANVQNFQINEMVMVPPIVIAIIMSGLGEKYSLKSVRQVAIGAAPLGKDSQDKLKSLLSPETTGTQVWGMTEASCVVTTFYHPEDDSTGSVGRLMPNLEAKYGSAPTPTIAFYSHLPPPTNTHRLIDENDTDISAHNVRGEMCIRGPTIVRGYFENPAANAAAFDADGFYKTGDIMYCDAESGKWYIVDRKKELIKVRAFQVAPPELETVLLTHPHIVDAAVIGVRDVADKDLELPRAYVVRRPVPEAKGLGEGMVKEYCAARLAKYKALTGGVRFVDAIPKNASGKILKRVLREEAELELKVQRERL